MLKSIDTDRVASGYATAGAGYASAATAAYVEMLTFGFDMWCAALSGLADGEPLARAASALPAKTEPAFGLSRDDWCGLPWLDPARADDWARLMFATNPVDAFAALSAFAPLRGSYVAWPMAKSMIDAGVPRSVAWPAAEANAAALDATDAACAPLRKALGDQRTPMGAAMSASPLPGLVFMMWALPAMLDMMRPPVG